MRVEESVEINRPPEEVFDYVANPENLPEWSGIVLEVHKEAQGELREGERFTTMAKFLGRRFETPMQVTAHEPPDATPTGARAARSSRCTRASWRKQRGAGRVCGGCEGGAGRLFQVGRTAARDGGQAAVQGRPEEPQGSAGDARLVGIRPSRSRKGRSLRARHSPLAFMHPSARKVNSQKLNSRFTEFSEVQLRGAAYRSVRMVMSSSCSQPSPTKE
jgi:hypothetical protein